MGGAIEVQLPDGSPWLLRVIDAGPKPGPLLASIHEGEAAAVISLPDGRFALVERRELRGAAEAGFVPTTWHVREGALVSVPGESS